MSYTLSYHEFMGQFAPYHVPELLKQLFELEQQDSDNALAEGFYLRCFDKSGLQRYCSNPTFPDSFIEFAQATYTGSSYAFWLIANDLEHCPIVTFGDEGGILVIAQNFQELLLLLTFDTEPIVLWDRAFYYRSNAEKPERKRSMRHVVYLSWISERLQLGPVATNEMSNSITEAAQEKYQSGLNDFLKLNGIEVD